MINTDWEAIYVCHFNANLHEALATRYRRFDLAFGLIAALAACSALASTLGTGTIAPLWQFVLLLSAVSAAINPVLRFSELRALHASLASEYRSLESRISDRSDMDQIKKELAQITMREPREHAWGWDKLKAAADFSTRQELQVTA
jgi:hypothetical protein